MKIVQLLFKVARNTYSISRLRLLKLGYGKRFQVGQDVVVRYGFTVRMEDRLDSRIQIGSGTFFNDGCALNSMSSIVIGDKCLFGQGVKINDHDHELGSEFVSRCSLSVGDWTNALLHIGRKTSEMRSMGPLRIFQCHLDLESFGKAWRNPYRWNE